MFAEQRELVEAMYAMFVAAAGRQRAVADLQAEVLAARMRRHDPRGQLLEACLEIARHRREIEDAVEGGRRLVDLHQQAATARIRRPRDVTRRAAAAERAQPGKLFVAGAVPRGGAAAARCLGRWLAAAARHGPREQSNGQVRVRPGAK